MTSAGIIALYTRFKQTAQPNLGRACEACTGADRVAVPECVVEVQIFGDNGAAGHAAAEKATEEFEEQGRRIFLRFPPADYGDWNDFLQGRKTEAA